MIYELVKRFPEDVRNSWEIEVPKTLKKFKKIIFIGMGGCYISGMLLKQFLRDEIKIDVYQTISKSELELIDDRTLIIFNSYSGNTTEVIDALKKIKTGYHIVITSGGILYQLAKKGKTMTIKIPENIHQRFSFPYIFFPILKFLEKSKIIHSKEKIIMNIFESLLKNENEIEENAKNLSQDLKNKLPLIYATEFFYPCAYRMQTSLEEDAKILSHSNKIPELFHNELESIPNSKFYPIILIDKEESKNFEGRIDFFKGHIKDFYEFEFYDLEKEERSILMFYFINFLGFHLSEIKKTQMGETPLSDKIKKI